MPKQIRCMMEGKQKVVQAEDANGQEAGMTLFSGYGEGCGEKSRVLEKVMGATYENGSLSMCGWSLWLLFGVKLQDKMLALKKSLKRDWRNVLMGVTSRS
jgi:hypothetical protein